MRDKVKKGYEEGDYSGAYREDREVRDEERKLFEKMFDRMPEGKVLDLGCGTGLPFDRFLLDQGYDVTGVDIAEKHVEEARDNVPGAKFVQGDFFDLDFGRNSFDAVVSFYAIFHIPRDEHVKLFERIRYWLKDGGVMLVTIPAEEMDQYEDEIGGGKLVWSSYSPERNKELMEKAGLQVIDTYTEDWREETHIWVLAENSS